MRSIFRIPRRLAWLLLPALVLVLALGAAAGGTPVSAQQGNGTVIVQKQLVDANGATVQGDLSGYVFTISGGGTSFPTAGTNAQGQTSLSVAAGTYTITEQPKVGGGSLVGFFIGGAPIGNFSVVAGQTVTVTARNQVAGTASVTITKQVVDAQGNVLGTADRSGFQFAITGPSGFQATVTTDANGQAAIGNLAAGSYTVSEQTRAGFTLQSLFINGVQVPNGSTFQLAAGGSAQVIARNTGGGGNTVTITKQIVDANNNLVSGDRSGFQVTITCGTAFTQSATTDANGVATISGVPTGACTVSEASRSGFTLVSIFVGSTTTDIGNNGSFSVAAGQAVSLTIRNRQGGGGGETVQLFTGCNNVAITWPNGTTTATVAGAISPATGLIAIWRFSNSAQRFEGYSPIPNAPNDLNTVNRFDAVFICMNANGTLNRPPA